MRENNMPTKTGWLIIVLSLLMLVWELYVIISGSDMRTISEEFWVINDRTLIVANVMGTLQGHFFWPRRR